MLVRHFSISLYILLIINSLLFPWQSLADDFKLIPSIALKGEYNDNIFFSSRNNENDFISTISPGIELIEKTERLDINLNSRLHRIIYADENDLNAYDHEHQANFLYSLTSKLGFFTNGLYKKDSQPDRDLETAGLTTGKEKRIRQQYDLGSLYDFNERNSIFISYIYSSDDYNNTDETDDVVDYSSHTGNLLLSHNFFALHRPTIGRLNFSVTRYYFDDSEISKDPIIDNYSATVGTEHEFNEVFRVTCDIGGRYSRSEFDQVTSSPVPPFETDKKKKRQSEKGAIGQIMFLYNGETTSADLSAHREFDVASSEGGVTERTSFKLDLFRRFNYELSGKLFAEYFLNKADQGKSANQDVDKETYRIGVRGRYNFSMQSELEVAYNYTRQKDNENNNNLNRNVFFIRFTYQHPIIE